MNNYRRDLQRLWEYLQSQQIFSFNESPWHEVLPQHIRGFVATAHHQGLGGKSIQRALSATRTFINICTGKGWQRLILLLVSVPRKARSVYPKPWIRTSLPAYLINR
ncbi:site-specific integrase [Aliamphritea spongicola]